MNQIRGEEKTERCKDISPDVTRLQSAVGAHADSTGLGFLKNNPKIMKYQTIVDQREFLQPFSRFV